ncbi:MAG: MerR family transcriptional regulator, partial [Lapillicoccus sp.]
MVIRIGELSRRVGVSEQVLRAWESRYDLLEPRRTPAGYRLYSGRDELRVRTMIAHLDTGMSAAQAAVATLAGAPLQTSQGSVRVAGPDTAGPTTAGPTTAVPDNAVPTNALPDNALAAAILSGLVVELRVALDTYDEARAHAVIDELVESLSLT